MPSIVSSLFLAAGLSTLLLDSVVADNNNTHERSFSSRRRHHAKLAARQKDSNIVKKDVSTIVSGLGDGTLYFDINGGGTCGAVNGWSSYAETNGYAMCEPNSGYKTLAQRGTNNIVAMPSNMLAGHESEYCGKQVVVTYGGKTVDNLILWDGCAACNSNDGLDFSSTVFAEVFGADNCGAGRIEGMSWKITNKQIWDAATGDPVSGSSDDSGDGTPAPSSTWSSSSSSSSWTPEPTTTWSSSSYSASSDDYTPPAPSSSSKAWSESSQWVASTSPSAAPISKAGPTKDVVDPTSSKFQLVAAPKAIETSSQESYSSSEAAPSSSSSSSWSAPASSSSPSEEPEAAPSSSEDAPKPLETEQSPVPSAPQTSDPSDGSACNDVPGAWRCAGWSLQQCVQTPGDWTWSNRVSCKVAPLNCDSPNPVCTSY